MELDDISLLMPFEGAFHKFQYWFADAVRKTGINVVQDFKILHNARAIIGRTLGFSFSRQNKALIVLGCHRIESVAWPWCWRYQIVPVMWDLWAENFTYFVRFLKRCRVGLCFVTASQNVEKISSLCPGVKVVWIPEGINASRYPKGGLLADRKIDLLNYGRQVEWINNAVSMHDFGRKINHVYNKGDGFVFADFDSLTAGIRDSKMAISYPQCDTNPERCGGVETLTQRYWECMLSGTLMVGRAPKELVDICGYDPVIRLGNNPAQQIEHILNNIEDYQSLADKNRIYAEKFADWSNRVQIVMKAIKDHK